MLISKKILKIIFGGKIVKARKKEGDFYLESDHCIPVKIVTIEGT